MKPKPRRYRFRDGSRLPQAKAQKVGTRLEHIRTRHGALTADNVVRDARPAKSPLHPFFEWDNRKAGHQYRLGQARHLIRCIDIIEVGPRGTAHRSFINVKPVSGSDYVDHWKVHSEIEHRKAAVKQFLGELRSWLHRTEGFEELAPERHAIAQALASRKRKRKTA